MVEPEKPFACSLPDCGMTFTNEDHLQFHTKKHDMVLQLGIEQKGAFVVDQTPTPTRFIRNCEEMGLFQDLQNVNPFDEGFKRAMETKTGILSLENVIATSTTDDVLHTPQMVFPLMDGDATLYSATNNQRNITISRSSSDENGAVKEFETTTISKLTNAVTKISRVIGKTDGDKIIENIHLKPDVTSKEKDVVNETVYTNNVIKIHSNVEIRKDNYELNKNPTTLVYTDAVMKDANKLAIPEMIPPIMSQKSLDFVVDSLTTDCQSTVIDKANDIRKRKLKRNNACSDKVETKNVKVASDKEDFEVIIKLPNGEHVRMKAVDEVKEDTNVQYVTKEKLKKVLSDKIRKKPMSSPDTNNCLEGNIVPIPVAALIPVTIVNPVANQVLLTNKVPITVDRRVHNTKYRQSAEERVKRKKFDSKQNDNEPKIAQKEDLEELEFVDVTKDFVGKRRRAESSKCEIMAAKSAASRRYRERLKNSMKHKTEENVMLRMRNGRLAADNAALKLMITNHMKKCSDCEDLRGCGLITSPSGPLGTDSA